MNANAKSHRLSLHYLRMFLPVFLIAMSLGMMALGAFTFRDEQSILTARVGNLAARTATALDRLGPDRTSTDGNTVLSLLLADPAVVCAVVRSGTGEIIAAAPPRIGCKGVTSASRLDLPLKLTHGNILILGYNADELAARNALFRTFNMLAVIGSLLVAAIVSLISFHLIVGRPVQSLLNAIVSTNETGRPAKIAVQPNDELGKVIGSFNIMQEKLRIETARNAETMLRLDRLYNATPAMMFSIDSQGIITNASEHWIATTGYRREQLVGKSLFGVLSLQDSSNQSELSNLIADNNASFSDIPCQLVIHDGSKLHTLLSAVPGNTGENCTKLCVLNDITGLRVAQAELQLQTQTDYLTGLPNRKGLFDHIAKIAAATNDSRSRSAILFIDLDNFKTVNDTLGHQAGDELLKAASGRLKNCVAKSDLLARLGGDEFAIILRDLRGADDARIVANRILTAFSSPFRVCNASASVGTSIGIASFDDSTSHEDILRLADLAMYQSKQAGKNCISFYSDLLNAKVVKRDSMTRKINDGLAHNRFSFYLQPIIDLEKMKPVGAEALLRLHCPEEGLVAPAEIIRVAEETGLIGKLTGWSVTEGLRIASANAAPVASYVAVNLSPKLVTPDFVAIVTQQLLANPLAARNFVFEITETALFRSDTDVKGLLSELRRCGARIALDDFGTGYSSLSHIHRFPVDLIKLDRSFIKSLGDDNEDAKRRRALVRATASLALELGMQIVGEGIEDEPTLNILKSYGISYGQGYFFTPPLPEAACRNWMAAFQDKASVQPYAKAI